jgi:hypothetical protein
VLSIPLTPWIFACAEAKLHCELIYGGAGGINPPKGGFILHSDVPETVTQLELLVDFAVLLPEIVNLL